MRKRTVVIKGEGDLVEERERALPALALDLHLNDGIVAVLEGEDVDHVGANGEESRHVEEEHVGARDLHGPEERIREG